MMGSRSIDRRPERAESASVDAYSAARKWSKRADCGPMLWTGTGQCGQKRRAAWG